jgi:drug/metabolite transporter (DMT)-like permease
MNIKYRKETLIGAVLVAFAASLWGMDGIILTPQLYNLNVWFVVFILHAIPFLIMNFFLFKRYKFFKELNQIEILSLFFVALFGGAIGTWAIVEALFLVNFKSLSIVVLLQKLQPVFAIALAHLFLNEPLKRNFLLWGSIALIAGYFLTFGWQLPHVDKNMNTILAAGFAVLAAFSFGASTVFSKRVLQKLDFITATFFRYGATTLITFFIVLITGHLMDFKLMTPQNWLIVGIISLTSGSVAIFIYYYGLKKINAMLATIMELFFPITAILLDYIVNDQRLSIVQWISIAVLLYAIIQINRKTSEN